MATTEQLLTQILAELKKLNAAHAGGGGKANARSSSGGGEDAASDRELDGPRGDPAVKKNPPRWNVDVNGSFAGCTMSECTPEFLDTLAGFFDWQATKDEEVGKMHNGKPTAPWRRTDARLCRGWARRKRDGWTPPAGAQRQQQGGDVESETSAGGAVDDPLPF